jgi:hypothetical protein
MLAVAAGGCAADPEAGSHPATGDVVIWPYWPTGMRIHPLTRLDQDDEEQFVVESRIEFTDRDGVTSRAHGEIFLDLLPDVALDEVRPMKQWHVDLRHLPTNATHFDPVTRTYLFKLKIEAEDVARARVLRVTFVGAEGREFSDIYEVGSE